MNTDICNKIHPIKYPSIRQITLSHTREIKTKYIDTFFSETFKMNYFNVKNIHNEYQPSKYPEKRDS